MSQAHPDAVEQNLETHPVKLAIWIVIGTLDEEPPGVLVEV